MLLGMRRSLVVLGLLVVAVAACAPEPDAVAIAVRGLDDRAAERWPPTGTPGPSSSSAGPALTWVGDPITVAEAIQHRDTDLDDTELAIAGYAWKPGRVDLLPAHPPGSPAMERMPTTT